MLRLPFEYRIRGAGGRACPHRSPARMIAVRPPCGAVPWYVRTRPVPVVRPCVRAPRKCPFHRRARALAARVRACQSLVTSRVSVQELWKVCAHCGSPRVPFVGRARRDRTFSTPLEYLCPVPSRTKTQCGHRVLCWCECVARTGAYAFQCTAGRTMHVAGLSSRTRSTARSPPRCRSSSSLLLCAPAARAMPRRARAC
jgi:hypothetical protein